MFQLTVGIGGAVTVTEHPDRDTAHRHLLRHAVTGDYYLHTRHATPHRASYDLLRLTRDRRRPRRAGHAVLQALPTGTER